MNVIKLTFDRVFNGFPLFMMMNNLNMFSTLSCFHTTHTYCHLLIFLFFTLSLGFPLGSYPSPETSLFLSSKPFASVNYLRKKNSVLFIFPLYIFLFFFFYLLDFYFGFIFYLPVVPFLCFSLSIYSLPLAIFVLICFSHYF